MKTDLTLAFATLRQLAKMQYWTTRSLDFTHEACIQRVGALVREFTDDISADESTERSWWEMISNELNMNVSTTK